MLEPGGKFGAYDVIHRLGKGGMGEVWLLQGPDRRKIAAKILDPGSAEDQESRARFLREAEIALKIKSPYLVETYDIGEDPETGLCYILMEYVPGGSLQRVLTSRGRLPIQEALEYVRQVALALAVVAEHGVVHRDIKPDNILFGPNGDVKLADLGIARSSVLHQTTITRSDILMGTPAYMSPEQMINSHAVDIRSDIYALGIVLFEMLVGERPNSQATFMELMSLAIKGKKIPDIRALNDSVSVPVSRLVAKMCEPKASKRFATPSALAQAIADIQTGKGRGKNHSFLWWGALAAGIATVLVGLMIGVFSRDADVAPMKPEEPRQLVIMEAVNEAMEESPEAPPEAEPEVVETPAETPVETPVEETQKPEAIAEVVEPIVEETREEPLAEPTEQPEETPAETVLLDWKLDHYDFIAATSDVRQSQRIYRRGDTILSNAREFLGLKSIAKLSKVQRIECISGRSDILLLHKTKTLTIGLEATESEIINAFVNLAMLAVEDGYSTKNQPIVKYLRRRLRWNTMRLDECPRTFDEKVLSFLYARDPGIFGRYFAVRKNCYRTYRLSGMMSRHDYVGVLSEAASLNLFPAFGSDYRLSLTKITDCRNYPKLTFGQISEGLFK